MTRVAMVAGAPRGARPAIRGGPLGGGLGADQVPKARALLYRRGVHTHRRPRPTSRPRVGRAATLALSLVASGCASTPEGPRAPAEIVRAQIAALEAGDERGAARWLTPEAQARAPLWPAADRLPAATSIVEVGRSARWDGDEPVEVSREIGGWRIRAGVLGLARAESPERALDAFGRALVARDWAMVLELMPGSARAGWSEATLGAALSSGTRPARWRVLGEALGAQRYAVTSRDAQRVTARVTLGDRFAEVVVGRDGGGWKVFDVTPRSEYIGP